MPSCKFFIQGLCTRDPCPYRHVQVSADAKVCLGKFDYYSIIQNTSLLVMANKTIHLRLHIKGFETNSLLNMSLLSGPNVGKDIIDPIRSKLWRINLVHLAKKKLSLYESWFQLVQCFSKRKISSLIKYFGFWKIVFMDLRSNPMHRRWKSPCKHV